MLLRPAREELPSKTEIVTIVASSHFKRPFLEAQVRSSIVTDLRDVTSDTSLFQVLMAISL